MLRNYFKIALRNLVKNKTYSLINVVGLALGMAVSMLILLFVMHEFSFDRFHTNGARIYRILAKIKMGEQDMQFTSFSEKLGPAMKQYNPQVEEYVRVKPAYNKVVIKSPERSGQPFFEDHFLFADPSFFRVFTFKLKYGHADQVLNRPFDVVISERAAEKYFGDRDPIGKTLIYEGEFPMLITGVAYNSPSNSSFEFDFVTSALTYPRLSESNRKAWEQGGVFTTYLLLKPGGSVAAVEKNIKREGARTGAFDTEASYHLEGFGTLHLGNNFDDTGNASLIYIFAGVAALILFLALFNYMSLTTARSTLRAREVGVRKVVGAARGGLIRQFYTESILVCTLAFALALVFLQFMRQPFYDLLNLRIDSSFLVSPTFFSFLIALLVFTALLAGSYPALILSGFAPLDVLKGRFRIAGSGANVRRIFMVFQFTVSIALIVCSLVVKDQLNFMQNKKLGLYKDQVLSIPVTETLGKNYFPLRAEIREMAGIEGVTFTNAGLFKGYNMYFLKNKITKKDVSLAYMVVDDQFAQTLGLKWKTPPAPGVFGSPRKLFINQIAVKELGLQGDPIGQKVGETDEVGGVLQDFHFSSVQGGIRAMGLFVASDTTNVLGYSGSSGVLYVRLDPKSNIRAKVAAIGETFKKYEHDKPFEYYFLNDAFNETFKTEIRMAGMFSIFTAMAIFIACIGLFGLVTFTAETRTKEIGIRKVLGASVSGIVTLLSKDFMKLVLLAIVLALPIAYYFMEKWLQDFVYRIRIPVWIYLAAALLAVFIAWLTISFQSIRAALRNPATSLRSE